MITDIHDADRREWVTACDRLETRLRINKASGSADVDRWLEIAAALRSRDYLVSCWRRLLTIGTGWLCERLAVGPQGMAPWYRDHRIDVETRHFHTMLRIPSLGDARMVSRVTACRDAVVEPVMQEEMARRIAGSGAFRHQKDGFLIIGRVPA